MIVTAATAVLIAGIAWGAFAFGAVYPWGYSPLAAGAAAIGFTGLLSRASLRRLVPPYLPVALAVFVACAALQLIPLPARLVDRISPEASVVQAQYLPGASFASSRTLSVSPSDSARGLALFAAMALLTIGGSSLMSVTGVFRLCAAITIIGSLLAISGIVQKAMYNGKIFGFWTTLEGGNPYGPFVNRNHFAGWMLMAVPLTLGLLCATISRQARNVRPTLRDRLLWFTSAEASQAVLLVAAVSLMALSIVLTMSRSGILAATCSVCATIAAAWRGYPRSQRLVVIGTVLAIAAVAAGWGGVDSIVARFQASEVRELNGRLGAWSDALNVAAHYPMTGTGFNTYGVAMLFYQRFNVGVIYTAAHNDYLQILAEGGALLTVPAVACIVALAVTIRRRFKEETSRSTFWIRAGATIGILSIALQEIGEFSLQIPGNAFLFAVLCAVAIHQTPERRPRTAS